ncbi:MAG: sulfatase [Verrucomicrobiales bacterium]|nr:sulfatase [Verrucomicrobiales bacterium]
MKKATVYLVTLLASAISAVSAEKNVIFFITDDESPTLGCYGDKIAKTPSIDAVAKDGAVFLNAFATTASCSASRSVVMTGIHNHRNGQYGHQHSYHKFASWHSMVSFSMPRVMENAGYRTGQCGKYHVAPEEVFRFQKYIKSNPRNAVQMAEDCKEFITADDDKPFFLYFATSDPHRGGGKDKNAKSDLKPDLFGNKPDGGAFPGVEEVIYNPDDITEIPHFLPDTQETREELAHYYQSVARIDQGVAKLREILEEAGLWDKTMIVFTADHGMAFAGGKTTVYEGGLRVPFVVRNPYEENRGVRHEALISHIDITPSLLDFAGGLDKEKNRPKNWVDPKKFWAGRENAKDNLGPRGGDQTFHGKSWIPILGKPDAAHWDTVFASHTFHEIQMYYPMRVVRDKEYKLIWNIAHGLPYPFASDLWAASSFQAQFQKSLDAPYGQKTVGEYINRPRFEFYKIDEDPVEAKNLAADPAYAAKLEEYKKKLKDYQKRMQDPWIMKWDYE